MRTSALSASKTSGILATNLDTTVLAAARVNGNVDHESSRGSEARPTATP
jgi:hypothetical protein